MFDNFFSQTIFIDVNSWQNESHLSENSYQVKGIFKRIGLSRCQSPYNLISEVIPQPACHVNIGTSGRLSTVRSVTQSPRPNKSWNWGQPRNHCPSFWFEAKNYLVFAAIAVASADDQYKQTTNGYWPWKINTNLFLFNTKRYTWLTKRLFGYSCLGRPIEIRLDWLITIELATGFFRFYRSG